MGAVLIGAILMGAILVVGGKSSRPLGARTVRQRRRPPTQYNGALHLPGPAHAAHPG